MDWYTPQNSTAVTDTWVWINVSKALTFYLGERGREKYEKFLWAWRQIIKENNIYCVLCYDVPFTEKEAEAKDTYGHTEVTNL